MLSNEFKAICHEEFIKRGFTKRKNVYYLKGEDQVLCSLDIQTTKYGGGAAYINVDYYVGSFQDPKLYPSVYDSDLSRRMRVWSKDTIKGKHFWTASIRYSGEKSFSEEEIRLYIGNNFKEWVMPAICNGRKHLLKLFEEQLLIIGAHYKTEDEVLAKLKA